MDNEMIERCAKALWDDYQSKEFTKWGFSNELLFGSQFVSKPVPWEHITNKELVIESCVQEWRDKVVIVIKAMREPTLAMLQDGNYAAKKVRTSGVSGMTIEAQAKAQCTREYAAYTAMIDSITND